MTKYSPFQIFLLFTYMEREILCPLVYLQNRYPNFIGVTTSIIVKDVCFRKCTLFFLIS